MDKKCTLIINYRSMNAGGIEVYIYKLIKKLSNSGSRIIWLCDPVPRVTNACRDLMINENVERICTYSRGVHWFSHAPIHFDENEQIVILSFTPFEMVQALHFQKEYLNHDINCFYIVAHFTGETYFPERYFSGKTKTIAKSYLSRIIQLWASNNNILFFAQKHIDAYERNYQIKVHKPEEKLLKPVIKTDEFDYTLAHKRSKRNKFNLITVGRFDFPHKGYMLGLIRAYGHLKEKYPQLTLTIVGYGSGLIMLQNEISNLSQAAQADVSLVGEVAPGELKKYFDNAHMNISVSGCVGDGARTGLLSMNARHYCYDCEVYGFLPESKPKALSTEPGESVEKYIEKALNTEPSEYIELCKRSYDAYAITVADPMYIFKTKNKQQNGVMNNYDITKMKILTYMCKAAIRLKNFFRKD